jgi:GNAT superfamily N-acetyltransferase
MMPLTYRSPNVGDAETIAGLHVTCWREAYAGIVPISMLDNVDMADRIARWQRYIENEKSIIRLASRDAEPVGFIHAGKLDEPLADGADGHVFALYILARHHRQGIGRRLMGMAARAWLDRGGRVMSVGVLTANHGARTFYEALGARFVRPDTYQWHGHALDESIYIFENLGQLAHFA